MGACFSKSEEDAQAVNKTPVAASVAAETTSTAPLSGLTRTASAKVSEGLEVLTAAVGNDQSPELQHAKVSVKEAQVALDQVTTDSSASALESAQTKVVAAEAAISIAAADSITPESKAELEKVQSSVIEAKKIVEEAIRKATAT